MAQRRPEARLVSAKVEIVEGECVAAMNAMDAESVDAIMTDPPYDLTANKRGGTGTASVNLNSPHGRSRIGTGNGSGGFMGKAWDATGIAFSVETWTAALRVLRPGGHLVAFGGVRTHHRMMCAIEDAGFEIRDVVMWLFGSGFPKSYDTAQGIEKRLTTGHDRRPDRQLGLTRDRFSGAVEGSLIANTGGKVPLTTDEAKRWEGWGTALKPAYEPIIVARKPLIDTVAGNVLAHGTGALNIDGCRVPVDVEADASQLRTMQRGQRTEDTSGQVWGLSKNGGDTPQVVRPVGRWPANIVHDGSDEVLAAFSKAPGQQGALTGNEPSPTFSGDVIYGKMKRKMPSTPRGDSGSAARFFYCAKANAKDRVGSKHPTVKPVALMRWLVRLVTPPGGLVLDPFAGTGTTGQAALEEGFDALLIEREPEYVADIRRRIAAVVAETPSVPPIGLADL